MADKQHMTRRACLKTAPILAAFPAVAAAAQPEDQTFALIEAHNAAEAAYCAAYRASDSVVLGRAPTAEEWAANSATGDATWKAVIALCEYVPTTWAGSKAKSEFLLNSYLMHGAEEPLRAFVRSIAQMVRA